MRASKSSRTGAATKAAHNLACRCPRCRGRRRRAGLPEPETYHVSKAAARGPAQPEPEPFLVPATKRAMRKKGPRRPTVDFIAEVTKYIRAGCPTETAFRITLGARWSDGFEWLAVGAGHARPELLRRKPYRDLLDAVTKAEAEAEARHAVIVQQAKKEKWSAWWLARRHPERWAAQPTGTVAAAEAEQALIAQIRELRSRPWVDPRLSRRGALTDGAETALDDGAPYIDPSRKPDPVSSTTAGPTPADLPEEPSAPSTAPIANQVATVAPATLPPGMRYLGTLYSMVRFQDYSNGPVQRMHRADFEKKFQVRIEALTVVPEDPPPPEVLMFR